MIDLDSIVLRATGKSLPLALSDDFITLTRNDIASIVDAVLVDVCNYIDPVREVDISPTEYGWRDAITICLMKRYGISYNGEKR